MKLRTSELTRREFLEGIAQGGYLSLALILGYPVARLLSGSGGKEPKRVLLLNVSEPGPGEASMFRFGPSPAILLRTSDGELRALSAVCSHLGCTVRFDRELQRIWCACHKGVFDLTGKNVEGPPSKPLEMYDIQRYGPHLLVARRGLDAAPGDALHART